MTIKEYWNLIGREPFLAITWEPDFFQACSFRKMLMNHKNFHFTQISDKTKDEIFLKSPKTMFLGYFWPILVIFAWWGFFPKKLGSVTHNYIWAPNTMLSFRKNYESILRKLTDRRKDGQKDGWKDGQTLFYRTLPADAGGPITAKIVPGLDKSNSQWFTFPYLCVTWFVR